MALTYLEEESFTGRQGVQFVYTFPCAINSEWPRPASWSEPDPYVAEKEAVTVRLVGFYRRVSYPSPPASPPPKAARRATSLTACLLYSSVSAASGRPRTSAARTRSCIRLTPSPRTKTPTG